MPGRRRLDRYDDTSPPHPDGIAQRGGYSIPVSLSSLVPDAVFGDAFSPDSAVVLSANGLTVRLGATTYRILPAGVRPAADEETVDGTQAAEVLERAGRLDEPGDASTGKLGGNSILAEVVRRSPRAFTVVRLRPRAPSASSLPPEPAPPPAPPARKPKVVKEGWIEIEVVDASGTLREGDRYRLKLPDGRVMEGTVGSNGMIAIHGIDPGNAELTITSLDGGAWTA